MADPFTISVIQSGLDAAAAEMFDTLRKTAMSPIIYEVLDVGTGVLDADGALVSSGAGIPGFIGVLDKSVKAIIAREGASIAQGDIFALNDPNYGGVTHLNDVIIAQPVFHDGIRVAWVASIAHWGDIGGRTPGSMAVDVTEIVAEGLRLPPVRLYRQGARNDAIFDIITTNTRLPDFVIGDLSAQIAAGRRGVASLERLYQRYGKATIKTALVAAFEDGETRALAGLATLPKGTFRIEVTQDDGTSWPVAITITDNDFTVDLRDAPDEVQAPHNTSRDGAMVVCQMFFKALTDAERYANAGSFAPLKLLTRSGSIFHAGRAAPQAYYFEVRIRLFDLLWECMAGAMPDRLPAGHFATIFGTVIAGTHPDTGRRYTMVEPQMGGWGATADRPGTGPLYSSSHGDTFLCPAEIAEARYGVDVVERSLNLPADPNHRGGAGLKTRYRVRCPATLSVGMSRSSQPVWSANGQQGGTNGLFVDRAGQPPETLRFASGYALQAEDEISITSAYGGS